MMSGSKQGRFVMAFTIGSILIAACGGAQAGATVSQAPAAETPVPTQASSGSQGGEVTVSAADSSLGTILVDGTGMTLYLLTGDTPGGSICSDACATAWPPLTVSGSATAGPGVDGTKLGTIQRADGSQQVTYNGHPLYGFVKDQAPGDVNGQGIDKFGGIWYVVAPSGDAIVDGASSAESGPPASAAATVALADSSMGAILVDGQGLSLYLLTADSSDQSVCTDACATAWPPLVTKGETTAGTGVDASLLSTLTRADGEVQVTYNGHPLYTFKGDHAPGDVAGEGIESFGGTWYLISAGGEPIEGGAAVGPTAQPTSSYSQY
jgi:predicted lipoprotein with Yx(FWY)xxD motif